jgi:hypothetical protein
MPDLDAPAAATAATAATAAPATKAPVAPVAPVAEVDDRQTLVEWCISQSQRANQVELLGAFHAEEAAAGRSKDDAKAYSERYAAFGNRPA